MSVKTADKSLDHLYPPFREKLAKVLHNITLATHDTWIISEGYRSQERQAYLYAQGRSRPGQIITWKVSPTWHGTGLAADCLPKGKGYAAPREWWLKFRSIYEHEGLDNPAFEEGDLGHVQWTDNALRAKALVWVRNGFQDPAPDLPPANAISVLVDGEPVPDADAYLEEGRAWVKLRPVTDGLDLVIAEVVGSGEKRTARLVDDRIDVAVPVVLREGRAFVRAVLLPAQVFWLPRERTVSIERNAAP